MMTVITGYDPEQREAGRQYAEFDRLLQSLTPVIAGCDPNQFFSGDRYSILYKFLMY